MTSLTPLGSSLSWSLPEAIERDGYSYSLGILYVRILSDFRFSDVDSVFFFSNVKFGSVLFMDNTFTSNLFLNFWFYKS